MTPPRRPAPYDVEVTAEEIGRARERAEAILAKWRANKRRTHFFRGGGPDHMFNGFLAEIVFARVTGGRSQGVIFTRDDDGGWDVELPRGATVDVQFAKEPDWLYWRKGKRLRADLLVLAGPGPRFPHVVRFVGWDHRPAVEHRRTDRVPKEPWGAYFGVPAYSLRPVAPLVATGMPVDQGRLL